MLAQLLSLHLCLSSTSVCYICFLLEVHSAGTADGVSPQLALLFGVGVSALGPDWF